MKQPEDQLTMELPLARRRGRRATGEAKSNAERQRDYRERHGRTLSVLLPKEVFEGFEEYLRFKNLSKSDVIERLIRTQLLRKR